MVSRRLLHEDVFRLREEELHLHSVIIREPHRPSKQLLPMQHHYLQVSYNNFINNDKKINNNTTTSRSWTQLQQSGNNAFWPLVVTGSPYYISDNEGRLVYSSGKVCEGVGKYECYQTLVDGIYILRLGGGLFGRLTGFPKKKITTTIIIIITLI